MCDCIDNVLAEVRAERARQIGKGYTAQNDDKHLTGDLALAAGIVAADIDVTDMEPPGPRQWAAHIFDRHENDRRRQLVIAAAMLVAEIERMDRITARHDGGGGDVG